jgi:hypothetical protein
MRNGELIAAALRDAIRNDHQVGELFRGIGRAAAEAGFDPRASTTTDDETCSCGRLVATVHDQEDAPRALRVAMTHCTSCHSDEHQGVRRVRSVYRAMERRRETPPPALLLLDHMPSTCVQAPSYREGG